jgi:hypothetical protein
MVPRQVLMEREGSQMQKPSRVLAVVLILSGVAFLIYYFSNKRDDATDAVKKGTISGGEYVNDYFGFTFPIPEQWQVVSESTLERFREEGIEEIGKEDSNVRSALERDDEAITLLLIAKGEPGSEGTISILFEAIGLTPRRAAATNSADFLDGTIHGIESSVPGMRIITPVGPARLGGTDFAHCEYEVAANSLNMRQRIIARITKRHALVFYLTGFSSSDMQELAAVLERIRFDD